MITEKNKEEINPFMTDLDDEDEINHWDNVFNRLEYDESGKFWKKRKNKKD